MDPEFLIVHPESLVRRPLPRDSGFAIGDPGFSMKDPGDPG